jgi:hypothetical protein
MTQAAQSQIPQSTSRAEEAAFWDSRDITDFLAELEPVDVQFVENLSTPMTASTPRASALHRPANRV